MAFPGHEHTCTHAEPARATGRPRHTVQSCGAQAGRFLRGAPGRLTCVHRRRAARCRKRRWGSCRPSSPMALVRGFPPAAAAAVRKKGVDRLDAPTSPTGAPIFLSRRQCPRRLGKNPGYTTSPRSALPTDGEANTGGRTADPSARHRDPRAAAYAARARRNDPQKWLTRWHPASPGPLPHRRPPSPPRHHALPLRLPPDCSWAAAKFCFIFPG